MSEAPEHPSVHPAAVGLRPLARAARPGALLPLPVQTPRRRGQPGQEPAPPRRGQLRLRRPSRLRRRPARALRLPHRQPRAARPRRRRRSRPTTCACSASSAVVDYDPENPAAYTPTSRRRDDRAAAARSLSARRPTPCRSRSGRSTCSFFGSMNERRRAWLDRIQALGRTVTTLDTPLYGAERDAADPAGEGGRQRPLLRDQPVRAVPRRPLPVARHAGDLRAHRAHPSASGVRGLRVLARRRPARAVLRRGLRHAAVLRGRAAAALARFAEFDPIEAYADLLAFACGFAGAHHERRPTAAWQPERDQPRLGQGLQERLAQSRPAGARPSPTWCSISPAD